jgi:ribosomal protein S18 acetylase RimI-like enzyme
LSPVPAIRRAADDDVPALAGMLARAFMDDPVAMWACGPDALRPKMLQRFHATRMRHLLAHDEVWTTPELACAAVWAPPDRWKTTVRQDVALTGCLLYPRLLPRLPMVVSGFLGLERKHPRDRPPHWYLAVLGTEPSAQGQGLGSAVLAGVLEQCDSDGAGAYLASSKEEVSKVPAGPSGAYLESSKESNISFYERFGFRVTEELQLPRGPTMWAMWRDPPKPSPPRERS